jgi:hypothetical protein
MTTHGEPEIPEDLRVLYKWATEPERESALMSMTVAKSMVKELVERSSRLATNIETCQGLLVAARDERDELREQNRELKAQLERMSKPVSETGWLIEKAVDGRPHWLTCAWEFGWTDDAENAIRFSRREDAEQIASMMENEPISITEHMWVPMVREGENESL